MAARLGHDFGEVRIHADDEAAASARALGAIAWTVGRDVVFGAGRYQPQTTVGAHVLVHELAHVKQQRGHVPYAGQRLAVAEPSTEHESDAEALARWPSPRAVPRVSAWVIQRQLNPCAAQGTTPPALPGGCIAHDPQNCVTYEQWLASFENMPTFFAEGQAVVGDVPADTGTNAVLPAVAPVGRVQSGEAGISHPTESWIQQCLPENLRQTAYALPADCADIAVILRHVWLSAHHREDRFVSGSDEWVLGDVAGGPQRTRTGRAIEHFYSANVGELANPYADERGRPLRSFAALQNLLHPGDLLVWEHHHDDGRRSGGHTQTIVSITRSNGAISSIGTLQGNQPIDDDPAPGRRIETRQYTFPPSPDTAYRNGPSVWVWPEDGTTTLVAAGPAASVNRPAAQTRSGGQRVRRISDWERPLRASSSRTILYATFESALLELRSLVDAGQTGLEAAVTSLAETTGTRLRALTPGSTGVAARAETLQQLTALIGGLTDPTGAAATTAASPLQLLFTLLQTTLTASVNAP